MRTSYGVLAVMQPGILVAVVAMSAMLGTWPPLGFWIVLVGGDAAVWAGLLLRQWMDRRPGRRPHRR